MLYAISDLHLSLGVSKSMDIFLEWEGYQDKIKKNWINLVKKNDTVMIAGDVSWGSNLEESFKDFDFLNSLPGEKIILKGNHDYWWTSLKKNNDFVKKNNFNTIKFLQNSSYECQNFCICGTRGWAFNPNNEKDKKIYNREIIRLKNSLNHAKESLIEKIVFMHYPPPSSLFYKKKFLEIVNILVENNVNKCYYGHIHSKSIVNKMLLSEYGGVRFSLISCDYLNFIPKIVG